MQTYTGGFSTSVIIWCRSSLFTRALTPKPYLTSSNPTYSCSACPT